MEQTEFLYKTGIQSLSKSKLAYTKIGDQEFLEGRWGQIFGQKVGVCLE
jgi:hypothetical protein